MGCVWTGLKGYLNETPKFSRTTQNMSDDRNWRASTFIVQPNFVQNLVGRQKVEALRFLSSDIVLVVPTYFVSSRWILVFCLNSP
jgi:hypothetical protein